MQVQAVGTHVSELLSPAAKAGAARIESRLASFSAQIDEAILKYPSGSEVAQLLANISRTRVPEASDTLLREVVAAVAHGNAAQALDAITRLAALDPARAEALPLHSGLAPIRGDVDRLLSQLTLTARLDAETQIAQAAQAISVTDASPHGLLALANHLYDAGGYANYTDAAAIAQAAINTSIYAAMLPEAGRSGFDPVSPARDRRSFTAFARTTRLGLRKLWIRAPLLVLLLGWLVAGFSAGIITLAFRIAALNAAFDFWGLGFLALVGFGFYAGVRNVRFRTMR